MKQGRKSHSSRAQPKDETQGVNGRGDYDKFKRVDEEESERGGNKIMEEWSQRDEGVGGSGRKWLPSPKALLI